MFRKFANLSEADVWKEQVNLQNECCFSSVPEIPESSDLGFSKDSTKGMCASIVAKFQVSGISNSLVSSIVGDLEELINEIHSQVKHSVIYALGKDDPSVSVINEFFENVENPFADLNTDWKQILQPKIWRC